MGLPDLYWESTKHHLWKSFSFRSTFSFSGKESMNFLCVGWDVCVCVSVCLCACPCAILAAGIQGCEPGEGGYIFHH